jgi:hypothetical protein
MPSRNLVKPFFPVPPKEYDFRYMAELVRSFSVYLGQMQNPGEGRATFMVFTDLQTSDQGLEPGAVFRDGAGFLKVALANAPNVGGLSALGAVGSVTVTV